MVRGRKLQSIADEMSVSTNTAKSHTRHVYQKLGVHSSEELFDMVEKAGEIVPDLPSIASTTPG